MKKHLIFISAVFLIYFMFSCQKDDSIVEPESNGTNITDGIVIFQNNADLLLETLLTSLDTVSALDSTLKVILKDTSVASGEVSSQGISINYKNGIIGGILIDPEDGEALTLGNLNKIPLIPADINSFSPSSKKTIFINPHYTDRQTNANQILNLYNVIFPRIGYNPPITFFDNAATIDAMTSLSGYGFIHIYSHGWAYPKKKSITEVYLMTGEEVNPVTDKKYEAELLSGNIPVIKIHKVMNGVHAGKTLYFLSPSFFSRHNDLSKDSTIVYGGFCFGFLGGWPQAILNVSNAGAYTGFTWRVQTNWNASLARSLFDTLSNNTLKNPRTLDYWFTQTPDIPKQLWDNGDQLFCKIQYTGHSDLTLWEQPVQFNRLNVGLKIQMEREKTTTRRINGVDSSIVEVETADFGTGGMQSFTIVMNGNTFSGSIEDTSYSTSSRGVYGFIDPAQKTVKLSFYQIWKTPELTPSNDLEWSFSINYLPIDTEEDEYYLFKAEGASVCNYLVDATYEKTTVWPDYTYKYEGLSFSCVDTPNKLSQVFIEFSKQ